MLLTHSWLLEVRITGCTVITNGEPTNRTLVSEVTNVGGSYGAFYHEVVSQMLVGSTRITSKITCEVADLIDDFAGAFIRW